MPEHLQDLLEKLWGREVPKTVGMFPPFHTDCGKNTVVGEHVFINMGCKFQDQGLDDDTICFVALQAYNSAKELYICIPENKKHAI